MFPARSPGPPVVMWLRHSMRFFPVSSSPSQAPNRDGKSISDPESGYEHRHRRAHRRRWLSMYFLADHVEVMLPTEPANSAGIPMSGKRDMFNILKRLDGRLGFINGAITTIYRRGSRPARPRRFG